MRPPLRFCLRTLLGLLIFFTATLAAYQDTAAGGRSPVFGVSLVREYGFAAYRECGMSVGLYYGLAVANLQCESAANIRADGRREVPPPLYARIELTSNEIDRIRSLVDGAHLDDGRNAGCDSRNADGVFETLRLTDKTGPWVVVVSCNASFQGDPARRELLNSLKAFEERLRKAAIEARSKK